MSKESVNRPRVGIGVFVFRDGKFLMGWRRGSHGANTWTLPGGHMEYGESPEETAAREVLEETGMTIKNMRFGAITNDIFAKDNKHYLTVWVVSDWKAGKPVITEPDKTVDFQWFDFETLPEPLFPSWAQLKKGPFLSTLKAELRATTKHTDV
jgi:8-oxo-dGTP diphosphatase